MNTNYLKIALVTEKGGVEERKDYQARVTARLCRTAYETYEKYQDLTSKKKLVRGLETREFTGFSKEAMDLLAGWVVDAFGGQFTQEAFWDGFNASFAEVVEMLTDLVGATAEAALTFPKLGRAEAES